MQLVAKLNNRFFRSQSFEEQELDNIKQSMLQDQENLEFQVMSDEEFEQWLMTQ